MVFNNSIGNNHNPSHVTSSFVILWLFPIKWWEGGSPFKIRAIFFTHPVSHSHPKIGESSGALTLSIKSLCVNVWTMMESWPIQCTKDKLSWNHDRLWIRPPTVQLLEAKRKSIISPSVVHLCSHFRSVGNCVFCSKFYLCKWYIYINSAYFTSQRYAI